MVAYLPTCLPAHSSPWGKAMCLCRRRVGRGGCVRLFFFLLFLFCIRLAYGHNITVGVRRGGRDAFYWGHLKSPSIRYLSPPALFRFV